MEKTGTTQVLVLEQVKVVGVTAPETIARIARERGLNPQEVFVRLVFEYEGKQYTASQKLQILRQDGYEKLLKAAKNEEKLDISVSEKEFFYIVYPEDKVNVADLFSKPLETKRTAVSNFFQKVTG